MSVSVQKRQEWFTTAEIAAQNLPTMPSSRQGCERLAIDSEWRERANLAGSPLARRRKGYGGGWEYHYTVLPPRAVAALAARGIVTDDIGSGPKDRDQRWAFFDALPETAKAEARRRADAIAQVEAIMRAGTTKQAAVAEVCGKQGVSPATIYNWFKMVEGLKKAERLPALAPKYRGRSKRTPLPEEAFDALKADYLRLSQPSFESCYDRLKRIADEKGWTLPCSRTLRRRLEAEVPPEVIVLKRAGREALDALYPTQKRDRSHFHALEAVNADGHIWDVWVKWPGEAKPIRPVMVAIQDLHSNKIVGWRVGISENKELVRLAFADVFENFGIPDKAWLDNGRAFASKYLTGGTPNRFRFKVKDEEPVGVLTALGVEIHWTRPYSGRSKPIERAFRDMCDRIARHPAFEGAWSGNRPDAKPENYQSRAIDKDQFLAVLEQEIAHHNAKTGRKTGVCGGVKSFDQAFDESYANAAIRTATEAQLRQCLLAAENVTADRKTGMVRVLGNHYWCEALGAVRGQKTIVRFDPDDLSRAVHVYRSDGSFVATADLWDAAGFDSAADAQDHSRKVAAYRNAKRKLAEAEVRLTPAEVAARLPKIDTPDAPDRGVVRLVSKGGAKPKQQEEDEDFVDRFGRAFGRLEVVK